MVQKTKHFPKMLVIPMSVDMWEELRFHAKGLNVSIASCVRKAVEEWNADRSKDGPTPEHLAIYRMVKEDLENRKGGEKDAKQETSRKEDRKEAIEVTAAAEAATGSAESTSRPSA